MERLNFEGIPTEVLIETREETERALAAPRGPSEMPRFWGNFRTFMVLNWEIAGREALLDQAQTETPQNGVEDLK